MDLSIRWHHLFKDRSPINIPTGEDSACITCDGEQKWLPIRTRRTHAIVDIRQWSAFGEMHHGILADFEAATGLVIFPRCVLFFFSPFLEDRRANQLKANCD